MTFLEMCQKMRWEAGIAGTGPAAVTNQIGDNASIVTYIAEANREIQLLHHNWDFMWAAMQFETVIESGTTYALDYDLAATDMAHFDTEGAYIFDSLIGETNKSRLRYLPFQDWRRVYGALPTTVAERPSRFTVFPDNVLRLWGRPDKLYTLQLDYYRKAQTLVANNDVSYLPSNYHMSVVYRATMAYALREDDAALLEHAKPLYAEQLTRMEREYLRTPRIEMRPLA